MGFPHGETVIKQEPGIIIDAMGDRQEDWKHPSETVYDHVAVYPAQSVENPVGGRDSDEENWVILFKEIVDSSYRSRWVIRGEQWMQSGHAMQWISPFTGRHCGTQIFVKRKLG